MAEYIDREFVISIINTAGFWEEEDREVAITCVEQAKDADVVPVKHGKWRWKPTIESGEDYYICFCSCCGKECGSYYDEEDDMAYYIRSNYCPNCGAKMDEEAEGSG